ncbi:M3 family oligoendopeptidase [Deinococcus peraridilitoris]|uniref:Oligoendopeptidase, pepF/M3 family n=1 Tax=Deinococcus peraridilitoris (strain DSM 19664 / LMG 22246 / CIP 109416 / KR-200) TaxID=937777 RepID=K9ZVR9_DEIPD|nr:M3 family oligoendopeptidase [Deinococcus peraridilitoris]AFZ65621.1 oligoendopeptidase, pepF/M3 family [Deinococcus peraridilitoris DSM 19664]
MTLPRWNTSSLFPSLSSTEFQLAFDAVIEEISALARTFDELDVRAGGQVQDPRAALETVLTDLNGLSQRLQGVSAFIQAFVTTDAKNALAQARQSELATKTVMLGQLNTRFQAWVGSLGAGLESVLAESELARAHEFPLRKAVTYAQHQMSGGEEELASLLNLSGATAWAKLHGNITSQLTVPFRGEELPMSAIRNLASSEDRAVRREAYNAELAAWERVEIPLAAALNGIKGQVNVINRRRNWPDSVEPTLLQNSIDRQTLSAMQAAVVASLPDFRRYFRAKARLLGNTELAFYDLFAPVGQTSKSWSYEEAQEFIESQFRSYSDKLADFAVRAFREDWMDVPPAGGKRDGAFCMGWRPGESRILLNYRPDLDSVSTLAHELGHAYHNLCLKERTPLQKSTPMTLAETASIFCETIAVNAALQGARGAEKLYILETQLQGHAQVVVDIHSRFLFERSVFEAREGRDLAPQELSELMLQAQRATYGDGLSGELHPYMWAVKGHYYSGGLSYYNYPYTFGLLFGLGLYAQYQQRPDQFREGYDELLSATGLADAATLAARFGIDTRSKAFWTGSLNVIRANIDEYERIALGAPV